MKHQLRGKNRHVVPDEAILKWEADTLANAAFLRKENDPALKDTGLESSPSSRRVLRAFNNAFDFRFLV